MTADILDALLARMTSLNSGSPALPIAWPEVAFDPATDAPNGKYIEVGFFPNRPKFEGVAAGKIDQGFLLAKVVWPRAQGLIAPNAMADLIVEHFPLGLTLSSGAARVKVSRQPWVSQAIPEADQVCVPVTIPWTA